jgi:hypothetical protein
MEQVTGLLTPTARTHPVAEPRLLVESESRYRVFLENLADLVFFRTVPKVAISSPPGVFWRDVFVHSPISWWSFIESMLWHLVAGVAVWAVSAGGTLPKPASYKQAYSKSSLYYYPPSRTFSARTSSGPRPVPSRARHESPRQAAMRVAREQRRASSTVAAPDAGVAGHSRTPNLAASKPAMPSAPLSATGQAKLTLPSDWTSVVAPPPDLSHAAGRRGGLAQASVVEPPPDVSGVSGGRALNGPAGGVIEPPPSAQDSLRGNRSPFGDGRASELSGGSQVVPPPPSVQGADSGGLGLMSSLAGAGGSVVPPPPSVVGEGRGGSGRLGSLAGGGSQVVPPPPSIQGAGHGGAGRLSSLSGGELPVVPPPPSVQGMGNGGGGRGVASLASGGSPIVPPPPSVQGTGHGAGGRIGELGGGGSSVVPPPPSMQGTGQGGGGRLGSLAGGGLPVPPPPSLQGAHAGGGGTGGSGRGLGAMAGGSQVVPPPPSFQGAVNGGPGQGGNGRGLGSLAGASQVVPPPPAVQVAGNGSGGRGIGSVGGGDGVVPPPPSVGSPGGIGSGRPGSLGGAGTEAGAPPSGSGSGMYSGSTGPLAPMDALPTDAPATGQPAVVPQNAGGEDVPLRLVSIAMPTPGSSFFSNYEVYIAERRVRKGTTELIKLVYVFLPYQKRLSEYVQNNAKVYTLRVLRDPSCDESLMQMTWSEADQASGDASNHDVFAASDKNSKLPCYRTTAEDYQRALDRAR